MTDASPIARLLAAQVVYVSLCDFPRRIRREARKAEHAIPPLRNGDTLSLTGGADGHITSATIVRAEPPRFGHVIRGRWRP